MGLSVSKLKRPVSKNKYSKPTKIISRSTRLRTVESFIIIWLDINVKKINKTTQDSINRLRYIINSIQTFSDLDQYIQFINDITDKKVLLIISDIFNERLISSVENTPQINSIYIHGNNILQHVQWVHKHRKIKGIFIQIGHLCNVMKEDIHQCKSDLTPISIVTNKFKSNLNELGCLLCIHNY